MGEAVESLYLPVLEAIVARLSVTGGALDHIEQNWADGSAYQACELVTLNLRLVCELILLGSVAAHVHDAGLSLSDTKWRPKDAFAELAKVNEHPLPFPIALHLNKNGIGQHHADPVSQPISYVALSRVYGVCSDLLHAPTLRSVVDGRLPSFDVAQLRQWHTGFMEIMKAHALMLPERKIILLCCWSGKADEKPMSFKLNAMGPSSLDIAALPEFSLL